MKLRVVDIARAAGVSTATVDRVLNNRKGVHARTYARVHETINRLEAGELSVRPKLKRFDFVIPSGTNAFLEAMATEVDQMKERVALMGVEPRCHRVEGFHPAAI